MLSTTPPFRLWLASLSLVATSGCLTDGPRHAENTGAAVAFTGGPSTGRTAVNGSAALPTPPGPNGVPRPAGKPGNLKVLPWAGFKGAVTYTFDDANSSQIVHYPKLRELGVPMTFYLMTGKSDSSRPIWAQVLKDGHELGNHTQNHARTASESTLDAATAFIKKRFGVETWTAASPYGDGSYPPLTATRFLANRGVMDGFIGPDDDADPFNLYCYIPPEGAGASAFNSEVEQARSSGKWKIILLHGFTGGTDGAYLPVRISDFVASVKHARSLGDVWIDTMVNIAAYWRGGRVFSTAKAATSGDSTTWTWTLPAHFPPGKHLRVTVDGGTLTQAGKPVPWDEHGYYEIALDAGSLTLSP